MAIERNITAADHFFLGEDKKIRDSIFQADGTTPQDISGWAISCVIRKTDKASDPPLIPEKTIAGGGIAVIDGPNGIIDITFVDTDTATLKPGKYRWSVKRTDEGFETILTFGDFTLLQATAR